MLAIARALMSRPRLLMLDEPSFGVAPLIVAAIFRTIRELSGAGTTILLVEQNARMALGVAHRGYVIESGRCVLGGSTAELRDSPVVRDVYLGAAA
jgi:branched-chain amino acid transport system ATP-binding protein